MILKNSELVKFMRVVVVWGDRGGVVNSLAVKIVFLFWEVLTWTSSASTLTRISGGWIASWESDKDVHCKIITSLQTIKLKSMKRLCKKNHTWSYFQIHEIVAVSKK